MPASFHDPNAIPTLLLLIGLELVLGVDNVVVVGLLSAGLPDRTRRAAITLGLGIALFLRIGALAALTALLRLEHPVVGPFSAGDLVVLCGGLFLIVKAVGEIHREVEHPGEEGDLRRRPGSMAAAVLQITGLDLMFSVDSVMAAVGLTRHLLVLIVAVVLSFGLVLFAAQAVGAFVRRNPALRILSFAFIVCIGASLVLEGFHQHFPRSYLYAPFAFALLVERLHSRRRKNPRLPRKK
ncbi:MAG: TerC family protein [Opitutaceae bacterium]